MRYARSTAFTLVEVVIVCAVMAVLAGFAVTNVSRYISENMGPHAPWRLELEARSAAQWIRNMIVKAKIEQQDGDLEIPYFPNGTDRMRVVWSTAGGADVWRSDIVRFIVSSASASSRREKFVISGRFGTVTPAIDITLYYLDSAGRRTPAKFHVVVSGRGKVDAENR